MDFFDRHKALIITLLIFGILLLGLYNFNLSNSNQKAREFLVDLENFKTEEQEEPEPEQEQEEPEQQQTQPAVETHRAFNESEQARNENFDQQLNEIFERNSADREETSETESSSSGSLNLPNNKREQPQQRSDGDNTSTQTSTQSGGLDNSSITFSLVGRSAVFIPNPIYTCDVAGKVVINITVNSRGRVTATSVNKGSSTSSNDCLIQNALDYASRAVFTDLEGRNSQPGTITYHFQP